MTVKRGRKISEAQSCFIFHFPYYICHLILPLAAEFRQ